MSTTRYIRNATFCKSADKYTKHLYTQHVKRNAACFESNFGLFDMKDRISKIKPPKQKNLYACAAVVWLVDILATLPTHTLVVFFCLEAKTICNWEVWKLNSIIHFSEHLDWSKWKIVSKHFFLCSSLHNCPIKISEHFHCCHLSHQQHPISSKLSS